MTVAELIILNIEQSIERLGGIAASRSCICSFLRRGLVSLR